MNPGNHQCRISFPHIGIYSVSILAGQETFSSKIISTKSDGTESTIEYLGSENNHALKNASFEKTLYFTNGNNLHCSIFSGKNNTIIVDSPSSSKTYEVEFHQCSDPDNNNYPVVKIGNQWWMAENLKSTKYRDKTEIPYETDDSAWGEPEGLVYNIWMMGISGLTDEGVIDKVKTVEGMTFYGTNEASMLIDKDSKSFDSYSFHHRLRFNGKGIWDTNGKPVSRILSIDVKFSSRIVFIGKSSTGSSNQIYISSQHKDSILTTIPFSSSSLLEKRFYYHGGPTTLYIHSDGDIDLYFILLDHALGQYCFYHNYPANKEKYGNLYNWFAVNTGKLCPIGWHVPSDDEIQILIYSLNSQNAGGNLKSLSEWNDPNYGATNSTGFSGLPGGIRFYPNGNFSDIGQYGNWWTSTEYGIVEARYFRLGYNIGTIERYPLGTLYGCSVRCIKD